MHDDLNARVRYVPGVGRWARATMMVCASLLVLTACGGGSDATGTEHQTTASHVTAGDESVNSGGHGEDPNAEHDPEGADGVHDEAAAQPHPDDAASEGSSDGSASP